MIIFYIDFSDIKYYSEPFYYWHFCWHRCFPVNFRTLVHYRTLRTFEIPDYFVQPLCYTLQLIIPAELIIKALQVKARERQRIYFTLMLPSKI